MAFQNPFEYITNEEYDAIKDIGLDPSVRDNILSKASSIRKALAARRTRQFSMSDRILTPEEKLKIRVDGLSSWNDYCANQINIGRGDILEEEEEFRLSLDPKTLRLDPVGPSDAWATIQSKMGFVDLTADIRNSMSRFTPMEKLDNSVPKPLNQNLRLVDSLMTSTTKNGAFLTAKPGSGKTTVFTALYPRMIAELALNWKHLWWVDTNGKPRREPFTKENFMKLGPIERRILFMENSIGLTGSVEGLVGEQAASIRAFMDVLKANPKKLIIVIDEVYDILIGANQAAASGDDPQGKNDAEYTTRDARENFVSIIKNTTGGGAKKEDYDYKIFLTFATENIERFNQVAPKTFMNAQMRERLGMPIAMQELPWIDEPHPGQQVEPGKHTHKVADNWLENVFDYFGRQNGYNPPSIEEFPAEQRNKILKNIKEVIHLIVEKTYRIYIDKNKDVSHVQQPSPQRALNSAVSAIFQSYNARITGGEAEAIDEYDRLTKAIQKNEVEQKILQREIALEEQGLKTQSGYNTERVVLAQLGDDDEELQEAYEISPRQKNIVQTEIPAGQSETPQPEAKEVRTIDLKKQLLEQKRVQNRKLRERRGIFAAKMAAHLESPKIDDVLGPVSGDYVTPDLSNLRFIMKSDIVATTADLIRNKTTQDEEADAASVAEKAKQQKDKNKTKTLRPEQYSEIKEKIKLEPEPEQAV